MALMMPPRWNALSRESAEPTQGVHEAGRCNRRAAGHFLARSPREGDRSPRSAILGRARRPGHAQIGWCLVTTEPIAPSEQVAAVVDAYRAPLPAPASDLRPAQPGPA